MRHQQAKGPWSRQRKHVDPSDLFTKHSTLAALPSAVGLDLRPLEQIEMISVVFWSKAVDAFSSVVSKKGSCAATVAALQELVEIVRVCETLISPLSFLIDKAVQELCGKTCFSEDSTESGLYQVINFLEGTLLPFANSLMHGSGATERAKGTFPNAKEIRAFKYQTGKSLVGMKVMLHGRSRSGDDAVAQTTERFRSVFSEKDSAELDSYINGMADRGVDDTLMHLRALAVEDIRQHLERCMAVVFKVEASVQIFGSTLTGLTHPRSDIDFTVISRDEGHLMKEHRRAIISELKGVELLLEPLSEVERVAALMHSCIAQYENIVPVTQKDDRSAQESYNDDIGNLPTELAALEMNSSCKIGKLESKRGNSLRSYCMVVILNKAKLAFLELGQMYDTLRSSATTAFERRRKLRQQLSSVDNDLYAVRKRLLLRLGKELRCQGQRYGHVIPVTEARIGVVKFTAKTDIDNSMTWECDLVINQKLGISNSKLIRAYLDHDTSGKVKRFLLLIKLFAESYQLNSASTGLLSSYGWIVLGLHFLLKSCYIPNFQDIGVPSSPETVCDGIDVSFTVPSKNATSTLVTLDSTPLSEILLGFFLYMTEEVNFATDVLTMRGRGEIISKSSWSRCLAWRISIEDPFERSDSLLPHDLGSTVSMAGQQTIVAALTTVASTLKAAYQSGDKDAALRAWNTTFSRPKTLQKEGKYNRGHKAEVPSRWRRHSADHVKQKVDIVSNTVLSSVEELHIPQSVHATQKALRVVNRKAKNNALMAESEQVQTIVRDKSESASALSKERRKVVGKKFNKQAAAGGKEPASAAPST